VWFSIALGSYHNRPLVIPITPSFMQPAMRAYNNKDTIDAQPYTISNGAEARPQTQVEPQTAARVAPGVPKPQLPLESCTEYHRIGIKRSPSLSP